jgi:hypothetical protein
LSEIKRRARASAPLRQNNFFKEDKFHHKITAIVTSDAGSFPLMIRPGARLPDRQERPAAARLILRPQRRIISMKITTLILAAALTVSGSCAFAAGAGGRAAGSSSAGSIGASSITGSPGTSSTGMPSGSSTTGTRTGGGNLGTGGGSLGTGGGNLGTGGADTGGVNQSGTLRTNRSPQ